MWGKGTQVCRLGWRKAGNSLLEFRGKVYIVIYSLLGSRYPLSLSCGRSLIQAGKVQEVGLSPGRREGCGASVALRSLR